jgi:valyl-tRNA synthetase
VVEPNLSRQWFVRAKPLADAAAAAVREGRTRIVPETWAATYFDWLDNIRDWCISRQIWWGHQIPAWTCAGCGEMLVALEAPGECQACGARELVQETDVLDTWFSSALWPFSTMGWPDRTPLLAAYYPTAVLVTGFDILFFWVARMMMMGLHFMGEVPFRDVYVHALVRDEEGRKMSKSKGNVIDPLTVMDAYGTDAFRFTLAAFAAQGRDVRMSEKRVEGYRHFVNKLWNAARFASMHLERPYPDLPAPQDRSLADRWILSRLARATAVVAEALDGYRFNDAAAAVYGFFWHEVCDWYLEAAKPILFGKGGEAACEAARATLARVLRDSLVLLHPFMPFVTEELWHRLPGCAGSVSQAAYPAAQAAGGLGSDPHAEEQMALVGEVITAVRNIRGEMNIAPALLLQVTVQAPGEQERACLALQEGLIRDLARLEDLTVQPPGTRPRAAATAVVPGATVFVSLEGILDFAREAQRLEKEIGKLTGERTQLSRKLSNEDFLAKAPPEVVAKVQEKHAALLEREEKLQANLQRIRAIEAEGGPC